MFDEGGFLATVQQFVDPVAVVFAMTVCWLIKQLLFKDAATGLTNLAPGNLLTRIFPAMPILLAVGYVIVTGYHSYAGNVLASKGIVSGAMAGYLNRTWKVT